MLVQPNKMYSQCNYCRCTPNMSEELQENSVSSILEHTADDEYLWNIRDIYFESVVNDALEEECFFNQKVKD